VPTQALGWILCATLLAGATAWLWLKRPWESQLGAARPTPVTDADADADADADGTGKAEDEFGLNRPAAR
jgi:hypothetical protein